jgi:hypothetical protein
MMQPTPGWQLYERMIARLAADQLSTDLCVTPNARVKGKISGRSRQIDALVDVRHDTDNSRRIVVDAKQRKRKIDVTDVEALEGLMKDVGATHGYLVSNSGYTKAAEKRAQLAVSIRIIPVDRIENFDPSTWPKCLNSKCKHGRVFWDGYPELTIAALPMNGPQVGTPKHLSFIHYVGKCDRCGRFHVWCTTCKDVLSVPENEPDDCGHQCGCKLPWFWLASIEQDEEGNESAELHAVMATSKDIKVITVDRRSS